MIAANQFRDGIVPAGMGNHPGERSQRCRDHSTRSGATTALYEHDAMTYMDQNGIRYAISAARTRR
ncbi:MAG: hypothetical protein KJZ80_17680 [Hyphomicrobiaceae bacterium]|nr:hypothetical protein [Hyphomicrobiaceae bacterium]